MTGSTSRIESRIPCVVALQGKVWIARMVKRILRQCGRLLRMGEVLRRIGDACVVRCGGLRLSVTVGAERVVEIVYYLFDGQIALRLD